MAISLQNILRFAENSGQNPDGSPFDQRSLGYGDNPPLVLKDLPKVDQETNGALGFVNQVTDNFVRGGAVGLGNAAIDDLKRLGKILISPNGLAWSAAQIALARTNPVGPIPEKSEGGGDEEENFIQRAASAIDEATGLRNRKTLPINTLLTAGTGAAGIRFRKDGLVDLNKESGYNYDLNLGGDKYDKITRDNIKGISENFGNPDDESTNKNKLLNLFGRHILELPSGMDSVSNDINFLLDYKGGAHSIFGIGSTQIKKYRSNPYNDIGENGGYLPFFNPGLFSLRQGPNTTKADPGTGKYTDYKTVRGLPNQVKKTRIDLYKMGDPGIKMDNGEGVGAYNSRTVDRISAASIFKRNSPDEDFSSTFKDYIKFRIAVVDTSNPLNDNMILFRALLDNVADNFSGEWNSFKYNGRAEKFYTYGGFDRSISFGFKIHTQTRHEQKPLWRKLNYLVAQTAPEYKNRRMRGVFSRLTIGDWMNEIPGFFTSINLSWNTAYPWEIRHDDLGEDKDLNEYPHILDVSCAFQPVHNFAPSNSATTPFLLPEIGVKGNRKYAQQSDNEDQDEFDANGIAKDAEIADIDINETI
tara:strand:+ start:3799 stop:5556 length:1758 start_codon:yes stop_codon:yes gene_type:complete